jgi:hypothetical protein
MTGTCAPVGPAWLTLREAADPAARSSELVERLGAHLPASGTLLVHDLACGTGAVSRWLAPMLGRPQHWVMHDRDDEVLDLAAAWVPSGAVTVEPRHSDVTKLTAGDLAGASLVTASALLDLLSAKELDAVVDACAAVRCPVLLALSVTGVVELTPTEPFDRVVQAAFNDHQRRTVDGRCLLGPGAVAAAARRFRRHGADVLVRPSAWRLGPDDAELTTEWFAGWLEAAVDQRPELCDVADEYLSRRLQQAREGRLRVVVHHEDLLALPSGAGG